MMTDAQEEPLEKQNENTDQVESPEAQAKPVNDQNEEEPLEDRGNQTVEETVPVPPQFQSPYFPNGVYEDARAPEKEGIDYDPFAALLEAEDAQDEAPKRKIRVILGVVLLVLVAALVAALVTGRLVMPF